MENLKDSFCPNEMIDGFQKKYSHVIARDKHKFEMLACISFGIISGCVTQAIYGVNNEWSGLVDKYCGGFWCAFAAIAPVTLGFAAAIFICTPFKYLRLLIYPASVFRGMGLGALICGAIQSGSLREMCFAALALLPYSAASCVITVYAGDYALGLKESFTDENRGLTNSLLMHALKMLLLYLLIYAVVCTVFAATCKFFGRNLI